MPDRVSGKCDHWEGELAGLGSEPLVRPNLQEGSEPATRRGRGPVSRHRAVVTGAQGETPVQPGQRRTFASGENLNLIPSSACDPDGSRQRRTFASGENLNPMTTLGCASPTSQRRTFASGENLNLEQAEQALAVAPGSAKRSRPARISTYC